MAIIIIMIMIIILIIGIMIITTMKHVVNKVCTAGSVGALEAWGVLTCNSDYYC